MAGAPNNRHIDVPPPAPRKCDKPLKDMTDPPMQHYWEMGDESGPAPAEKKPSYNVRKHMNRG